MFTIEGVSVVVNRSWAISLNTVSPSLVIVNSEPGEFTVWTMSVYSPIKRTLSLKLWSTLASSWMEGVVPGAKFKSLSVNNDGLAPTDHGRGQGE